MMYSFPSQRPSAGETEMRRRMLLLAGMAASAKSIAQVTGGSAGVPLIVLVGGPPGTPGDLLARTLADPLAAELKQPVVVENRPGAAGTVAMSTVARGKPDGQLLGLMGLQSAVAPALIKSMPYDTGRDLVPVRQLTTVNNVLVVHSDSPWRTLDDLLAAGHNGALTYASGGNATPAHLAAELFAQESRLSLRHIPFNGATAGITALLGGHVQLMFATVPAAATQLQAGRLRALATSSRDRIALLPAVPTVAELGWPGAVMHDWHGLVAPVGTNAERVRQLSDAATKVLTQDGVRQRLAAQGLEPVGASGPQEFKRWIDHETELWSGIVLRAGISLQ
jgi:tripartite-type tricarboxylate transporter receptor subunit TctC